MYKYPVDYIAITQGYHDAHKANDYGWNSNYGGQHVPIKSITSGTVTAVVDGRNNNTSSRTLGNYVTVKHDDGNSSVYAHLLKGSLRVKINDRVDNMTILGLMNNSGYSFGSHLHLVLYIKGIAVDPHKYLYAFPGQVISGTTARDYNILKYVAEPLPQPTPSLPLEINIGDTVIANGTLYSNSYGGNAGKTLYNHKGVVKYKNSNGTKPFHIDNLGWMAASDVKLENQPTEEVYIVKPGDNLSKIAEKFNTSWKKIYEDNKSVIGSNANLIRPGQRLVIRK